MINKDVFIEVEFKEFKPVTVLLEILISVSRFEPAQFERVISGSATRFKFIKFDLFLINRLSS